MEMKIINEKMEQLAQQIDYRPEDITHLANAMCVNVLKNGNTSNKEYFNGSLATLGDSVLKMIITEKLYLEGKDRGSITASKSCIESNKNLHFKTLELNIQSFAYNDQFFFDDAPKHLQLPNPGHDIYIEAIIGAIYLDRGLEYCKKWIESSILIDWTFEETSVS